jgi:RNA polymerase sigma-70 factor (ECF subfamily)
MVEDESAAHDAWEAARSAWPGIDVPLDAYRDHVRVHAGGPITVETLAGLDTVDLYLACACIRDDAGARELLSRSFFARVDQFVRHLDPSPAFADEVRQQLAEKLLLGTREGGAKLADYAGRGPLGGWIRVAALRVALNLVAQRTPGRAQTLDEAVAAMPGEIDVELEYLRARYLPLFRDAIRDAIAGLTSQQRNVLRLHLVSGISTEKIGALFRVNQSTAVRWLQSARAEIRRRTEERLLADLGTSPSELASLTRLLLSRLDVSITGLLRDEP